MLNKGSPSANSLVARCLQACKKVSYIFFFDSRPVPLPCLSFFLLLLCSLAGAETKPNFLTLGSLLQLRPPRNIATGACVSLVELNSIQSRLDFPFLPPSSSSLLHQHQDGLRIIFVGITGRLEERSN